MHEVQLNISSAQLRKLHNGHNVQLANSDIGSGDTYMVSKKFNTKVKRAKNNGKGLRISLQDINVGGEGEGEGGDLLKKIGIKKKVIKYGNKYGLPIAKTVAKAVLPAASKAVGDAVAGYTGSPLLGEVAKSLTKQLGNEGIEQIPNGGAMRKFTKGSPEAKAYMASLRAKRSSGGSFRPNGKSGGSFKPNGGSFRPNGGAISSDLIDGHYAVLPNSHMYQGINAKNGNPLLKGLKSTDNLYNDGPRVSLKGGRGLNGKTVVM
jgi:hypothetical protein